MRTVYSPSDLTLSSVWTSVRTPVVIDDSSGGKHSEVDHTRVKSLRLLE